MRGAQQKSPDVQSQVQAAVAVASAAVVIIIARSLSLPFPLFTALLPFDLIRSHPIRFDPAGQGR